MTLKVVGAGLGRTGTHSLQLALQTLLGAPCYHMLEVFGKPEHIALWDQAADGNEPDWDVLFDGYAAAVDWPASAYWRQIGAKYPDAPILLSTRSSADVWFKSASDTIFQVGQRETDDPVANAQKEMALKMFANTFTPDWQNEDAVKKAYDAHNAAVRAEVPPERLIDWQPGDGWAPICEKLGLPIPDEPFPHVNTTAEFRQMLGLDS
jgi:hypothetical protein